MSKSGLRPPPDAVPKFRLVEVWEMQKMEGYGPSTMEQIDGIAYEMFCNGEISSEELASLYDALGRWSKAQEDVIKCLRLCDKSAIMVWG